MQDGFKPTQSYQETRVWERQHRAPVPASAGNDQQSKQGRMQHNGSDAETDVWVQVHFHRNSLQ